MTSNIGLRYARTELSSLVKNPSNKAQALDFRVVLPKSAFISNFSMTIKGKVYVAQVKEKEEARKVFDKAVSEGRGAAIVEKNVRDSNHFAVSTNVAAGLKVQFKLTYEELLERRNGMYQQRINVHPKQIVDDLKIEVFIKESLPLSFVSVPELKESNEVTAEEEQESKVAIVKREVDGDSRRAHVVFRPDRKYQEQASQQGISGMIVLA